MSKHTPTSWRDTFTRLIFAGIVRVARNGDDFAPPEPSGTTYAQGPVVCSDCGHRWQAVVEEAEGVPMIAGLECPSCRAMCGRWEKPRHKWSKEIQE